MKKASSKLLSHLQKPNPKPPIFSLIYRDYEYHHSLTHPSKTHLNSCSKTQSLFNPHRLFQAYPSHHLSTLVEPSQISSRQKKIKERSELEESFESAESIDEMLSAFKQMESCYDEKELGLACLKLGLKLDREGDDPQKTLSFAERALRIFDENDNNNSSSTSTKLSLPIAMTLQLLGSASFSLKKFSDCLSYLNRANRLLGKLESDSAFDNDHVLPVLHAVQFELFNVKTAMGRREEAIVHLKKALEIKEKTLDEDSKELGKANRDVAEAYTAVMNFKEALPYCLKALEIHKNYLGHNSVEVAEDRRVLGVIYTGLDEHENALEQNLLSQRVLKNWGRSTDLLRAEIDAANMQIALGRYEVALNTLKNVVQKTDKDSEDRAMIFTSMAKALCFLEKFDEAKKCLEISCGIYGKKEKSSPVVAGEAFMEISLQYESMNEFEPAISLLKRAFAILDKLPQEQHSVGSVCARIGWLFLLTGSVDQAVPYLEDAAERLKESFGSRHFGVGYVYNNLGAAYLELDRPQSAAQAFAYAKEIMDVALGPHHVDSIEACQNLSKAYATMKSLPLAINFQEKAVERLKGHGPSAQNELDEAVRVLEQLREKVSTEFSETLIKAMPPPEGDNQAIFINDSISSIEDLIKALPPDEAVSVDNPNSGISSGKKVIKS